MRIKFCCGDETVLYIRQYANTTPKPRQETQAKWAPNAEARTAAAN